MVYHFFKINFSPKYFCLSLIWATHLSDFGSGPSLFCVRGMYFGGFAAFMTKQFLDVTEIYPFFEQMGRNRKTKGM